MKLAVLVTTLLLFSSTAYADENSKYIVVKGSTVQCPDWHNRILEVVEVEDNEHANLLGIPMVKIRPLKSKAILDVSF